MEDYKLQATSVWHFETRGCWATHKGDYKGNWSPHIPRNLILKYTKPLDTVLDCFVGSGTTLIECRVLNRHGIGLDVVSDALYMTKSRISFPIENDSQQIIYKCDARNMKVVESSSVDFICTHPPYADLILYSRNNDRDLSHCPYQTFLKEMKYVARECYRVLKEEHYCAFMIGDFRRDHIFYPLAFNTMNIFLNQGFSIKDIIIKQQDNQRIHYWEERARNQDFYVIAHDYIFVLKK